jgi:hypothetical protein
VLAAAPASGLDVVQVGGGPDVDHIIESIGAGAAWIDYDGDGDEDLFLPQGATAAAPRNGPPDALLRNEGDADGDGWPEFVESAAAARIGDRAWSFSAAAADLEGDGDVDLYVTGWGPNRLYRNRGDGTFDEIADAAGLADPGWGADAVWADIDRDGDLDLYVVNYVVFDFDRYPARGERAGGGGPPCAWRGIDIFCGPRNLEAAGDKLYRNDGDTDGDGIPDFADVTGSAGVELAEPLFGLAAHFFDADDDGDQDLYVANDSVRNTFFVNRGDGTFEESSIFAGVAYNEQGNEQAGMGIATADVDGDGRLDLFVTNFSHDHDTLYRNLGDGLFTDVSYTAGLGTPSFLSLAWGAAFCDLDQDGHEDLVVGHGHVYPQVDRHDLGTSFRQRNGFYRGLVDGTFVPVDGGNGMALVEASRAVLPHDLDGDGDLDVLFTNWNAAPSLLRNDSSGGGWLAIRLIDAGGNREAIGARITLVADGGAAAQIREVRRHTAYGSVPPRVHFGVGARRGPLTVEVRWPDGSVTRHTSLDVGKTAVIHR